MKKTATLVLALLTFASVAQYNNTYDVNANNDNLTPSFVITNKRAESITVSYASDAAAVPRRDYFILTKHDAFGNVLYNNRIDPFNSPTDGFTNVEALIQTDDEGVLVAGYYYDNYLNFSEQPFLLKVDVNGNFQWARIYYVNQKPIVGAATNKISLCRVWDDAEENYFIVGAGDSDANPGVDVATNVIKVNSRGSLLFSKKYYNVSPPGYTVLREYPGDIDFSKPDKMYMITGYRQDATMLIKERLMYFFGIDNLGNVVTKFMTLASKSTPIDQDMVYDPFKNVFAVTFTHAKSGYVNGVNSEIGFLTIDASLAISLPRLFWHKYGLEHNGRSISLSSNGDYAICSRVLDNAITFVNNPAFLKIDNGANPITGFLRYNIKDDVYFGHHATSYNLFSGADEYVLANLHKTDLRMIRTDAIGEACGTEKFEPYVDKYEPDTKTYQYDWKRQGLVKRYAVNEKMFFPDYRKCDGDGTSYRTTGIVGTSAAENGISLYPSVLQSSQAYLTVENNSGAGVKMEVRNLAGQLIFTGEAATGKNEIKLNNLSQGVYLVQIYNSNGALNSSSKIVITE